MGKKIYDHEIPEGDLCWYESRNMTALCKLVKSSHKGGIFRATLQIVEIQSRTEMVQSYKIGDAFEATMYDAAPHLAGWAIKAELVE